MYHLSDDPIETIETLARAFGNRAVHLHLLRAIDSAGPDERRKLREAFPDLFLVYRLWSQDESGYPTGRELAAALELATRPGVKIHEW